MHILTREYKTRRREDTEGCAAVYPPTAFYIVFLNSRPLYSTVHSYTTPPTLLSLIDICDFAKSRYCYLLGKPRYKSMAFKYSLHRYKNMGQIIS